MYEQEALKSLLRIDDGKPVKIVKDGAENSEEATQEASTYPAIDLDMIIFDVDENESASTSQVGNPTQATQLDSSGSISLREQRIPNSRPLSIASSSALPRPYLTAESDLVNGVTDSQMARFTNPSTPTHVSLARADDDEMEQDDDTSESLLEALVEQYYDNHVENGSVWTATSSKHQADSITEDTFRRARTVWQGEVCASITISLDCRLIHCFIRFTIQPITLIPLPKSMLDKQQVPTAAHTRESGH